MQLLASFPWGQGVTNVKGIPEGLSDPWRPPKGTLLPSSHFPSFSLSPTQLTDKWVTMQTARRLFRTEDHDMVTRMNTVQETSEDKGVRAKRLSPCNPATQMSGNSICLCFHSSTNSFCRPNVSQHWLYTRYGPLAGTKTGKDAVSTTRLQGKSQSAWEGVLLKADSSCKGLEGTFHGRNGRGGQEVTPPGSRWRLSLCTAKFWAMALISPSAKAHHFQRHHFTE